MLVLSAVVLVYLFSMHYCTTAPLLFAWKFSVASDSPYLLDILQETGHTSTIPKGHTFNTLTTVGSLAGLGPQLVMLKVTEYGDRPKGGLSGLGYSVIPQESINLPSLPTLPAAHTTSSFHPIPTYSTLTVNAVQQFKRPLSCTLHIYFLNTRNNSINCFICE